MWQPKWARGCMPPSSLHEVAMPHDKMRPQPVIHFSHVLPIFRVRMYCPNCSSFLTDDECQTSCDKCGAVFDSTSTWRPQNSPPSELESTKSSVVFKALVSAPLFLVGGVGVVLAFKLGQNGGELAGIPAFFCLATALSVVFARSKPGIVLSTCAGVLTLLCVYGLLNIVGVAIYSR